MRTRIALCWAIAAVALSAGQVSHGQSTTTTAPNNERLNKLEQRVNQLEADVKSRDEEIARLKSQVNQPGATQPAPTTDEIDRTKQDVLKDLESREASPLTLRTPSRSM